MLLVGPLSTFAFSVMLNYLASSGRATLNYSGLIFSRSSPVLRRNPTVLDTHLYAFRGSGGAGKSWGSCCEIDRAGF
jgi:hypothetical protein